MAEYGPRLANLRENRVEIPDMFTCKFRATINVSNPGIQYGTYRVHQFLQGTVRCLFAHVWQYAGREHGGLGGDY